jgi:hypothetical protein
MVVLETIKELNMTLNDLCAIYSHWCAEQGLRNDLSADDLMSVLYAEFDESGRHPSLQKTLEHRVAWLTWYIKFWEDYIDEVNSPSMDTYTPDGITVIALDETNIGALHEQLKAILGD